MNRKARPHVGPSLNSACAPPPRRAFLQTSARHHPTPSFRTEQADFFFPLRSREAVGLCREKSLFLFPRPAHRGPLHHRCELGSDESLFAFHPGTLSPGSPLARRLARIPKKDRREKPEPSQTCKGPLESSKVNKGTHVLTDSQREEDNPSHICNTLIEY